MKLKIRSQQRKNQLSHKFIFKKINKTDKTLASLNKKRGKNTQITIIRKKKRRYHYRSLVTCKRIIKEYYEELYAHQFDNLDKMHQFLERPNLPKLTQQEIGKWNRPLSIKETESIIKNLPQWEASGPDWFIGEFYQIFKE